MRWPGELLKPRQLFRITVYSLAKFITLVRFEDAGPVFEPEYRLPNTAVRTGLWTEAKTSSGFIYILALGVRKLE